MDVRRSEVLRCGVGAAFRPVGVDVHALDGSRAAAIPPGRVEPFKDFRESRSQGVCQRAGGKRRLVGDLTADDAKRAHERQSVRGTCRPDLPLHNLPALRAAPGFTATRRLLDVQKISHDPADGQDAVAQVCQPLTTQAGTRVAGLRLGDPRACALLAALCVSRLLPRGFANRDLRPVMAQLLGVPASPITPGKMTYDLRRLRMHGLIERIPGTFRYQVSDPGITRALFLTRLHDNSSAPAWPLSPRPPARAATWQPPAALTQQPSMTSPGPQASPPDPASITSRLSRPASTRT